MSGLDKSSADLDVWSRLDALDPVAAPASDGQRPSVAIDESFEALLERLDGDVMPPRIDTGFFDDVVDDDPRPTPPTDPGVGFDEMLTRLDNTLMPTPRRAAVVSAVKVDRADQDILQTTARALKAMESFSADLVTLERQLNKMDEAYWALLGRSMVAT